MAEMVQIILLLAFLFQVLNSGDAELIASGISNRARKFIMREINEFRSSVNNGEEEPDLPTPLYLKALAYSEDIEKALQKHLNKCDISTPSFSYKGKKMGNMVSVRTSKYSNGESKWEFVIEGWLEKRKFFKFGEKPTRKAENFQQIVGERATEVGCAYAYCKSSDKGMLPYAKIYGCSFNAVAGRKPYETAED